MKIFTRILSLLLLVSAGLLYSGCGSKGGGEKPAEQTQLASLSKTWTLQSAKVGGATRSDFVGVTLTLSGAYSDGGTYQYHVKGTVPNPSPWPNTGTWKFGSKTGTGLTTQMVRDPSTPDQLAMTYTLAGSTLTINFTVDPASSGWAGGVFTRTESVSGNWEFIFN